MRLAFLSSTPPSAREGSGTFVGLDGLRRGLSRAGHTVDVRPLGFRSGFHTFDRWLYNARIAARPPRADVVVGVDLDGFIWARRRGAFAATHADSPRLRLRLARRPDGRALGAPRRVPYAVMLKGIIADELRHERGWVRALLTLQARWERANCARADRIVVPSRYSAEVAASVYAIPPAKLAVVPEPIDLETWRRLFAAADGRPASRPLVLAVARMYPRKRLQDLLVAASRLRQRIPDVQVRIVGEGPESAHLRRLHAKLGLGDSVAFLGEVPRAILAVEYGRAQCFCLPSVQEGFGLVFAEAMAAGLPVVACRAAAIPEVVIDGRTGLLVAPRSPEEVAAALERLLTNAELRKELGEAGRRRVEAFDLDRVAVEFLGVLPA